MRTLRAKLWLMRMHIALFARRRMREQRRRSFLFAQLRTGTKEKSRISRKIFPVVWRVCVCVRCIHRPHHEENINARDIVGIKEKIDAIDFE